LLFELGPEKWVRLIVVQEQGLLLESLVLYLKSLSVVGTAIKALRQVIDVLQSHMITYSQQPQHQAAPQLARTGSGLTRLGSIEERKVG
jgi:hypothetical protein